MIFKGFRFALARKVLPLPRDYSEPYIKFGRICAPDAVGAIKTDYEQEGQPVFAKPIELRGHSLTNMAYGKDGRVYLLKDGKCYSGFVKSTEDRAQEKILRRIQRDIARGL